MPESKARRQSASSLERPSARIASRASDRTSRRVSYSGPISVATFLKDHVATEMGQEYETLLELLSEAREAIRSSGRSSEDADWRRAFDSGILDLIRAGREAEARELLRSCL